MSAHRRGRRASAPGLVVMVAGALLGAGTAAGQPARSPAREGAPASAPASQAGPPSTAASAPAGAGAGDLEAAFREALAADAAADAANRGGPAAAAGSPGGAATTLNPDLSVIADLAGGYFGATPRGLSGDDPAHDGVTLQELELALTTNVDAYFRGEVYLTIPNLEGIEVEEAAITTLALPWSLQLRAGVIRGTVGRQNVQHLHVQDFPRRPQLNALLLGHDGFRAPGAELSWLLPLPFYCLVYGGAFGVTADAHAHEEEHADEPGADPEEEPVAAEPPRPTFGGGTSRDLTYLGGLKVFVPLGEEVSLYVGGAFATGWAPTDDPAAHPEVRSYLYGGDLYLRWRPPNVAATYLSLSWQTEYFARSLEGQRADGAVYSQVVMRVARRWSLGVRGEVLGLPRGHLFAQRAVIGSAMVTFRPTEYSSLRVAGEGHAHDLTAAGEVKNFALVMVQLQVSMGAHGAHAF